MNSSFKLGFASAVVTLGLVFGSLPVHAAGLTSDQINAVVTLLQSFNVETKTVDTVKAVLNGQKPPRTEQGDGNTRGDDHKGYGQSMAPGQMGKMMCIALMRDLGIGSKGDDVRKLQDMLREAKEAGFTGSSTGFYGPMTAEAMKRFQKMNGIASTTTGNVGPATRGFLNRACGKGLAEHNASTTTHQ